MCDGTRRGLVGLGAGRYSAPWPDGLRPSAAARWFPASQGEQSRGRRKASKAEPSKQRPAAGGFSTLISFLSTIKIEELWWIFVVLISFFSKKDN
jgi:hypothetical protein